MALVLLAQDMSVTATAHRCGYQSTSAFIDAFRAAMGATPGKFFDERHVVQAPSASASQ